MDELIVGTYEGFLLGYSFSANEITQLKQTFATHSHTASIRCVSISGRFLASGGTDDKFVIIDLKTRTEHTVLMNHDGTINTVAFTNSGTHLLTGSDDGTIIVTRTGNWQMEKIWKKAHGGQPVTNIAIHPTDKLALSIGGDKTLRTWNLIKGRPAFTINLASKGVSLATEIKFSPGGDRFSLISQQNIDVWTISQAGLEKRLTCNSKPTTVQWVDDNKMFVGMENGNVVTFTVSETEAKTYPIHKQRVKCLYYDNDRLYSASSTGELKVWSTADNKIKEICSVNASCRITCMVINRQSHIIKQEKKEDSEIEEEQNDISNKTNSDSEEEIDSPPPKRKPGAFVSITYGDEANDDKTPLKKTKKKRKSKKKKNKIE